MIQHPVTKVLVAPGDRVKAGQPLVELDSDEPEAEVRAKRATVAELQAALARVKAMPRAEERAEARATLEGAEATTREAREYFGRVEKLRADDAVSARQHREAHLALLQAEAAEKVAGAHLNYLLKLPIEQEIAEAEAKLATAKAELDAHEAELEHYVIHAPIDGVVTWLDVNLGTVSRPGTSLWGEIVDLSELDVRCELTADQADALAVGQPVEVVDPRSSDRHWPARVVFVSPIADKASGRVPVVVRLSNTGPRLRVNVDVAVRLRPCQAPGESPLAENTGQPAAVPE